MGCVYNTTKYAVVGLSETLAKDLRPHGIGVSVLCPMGVATRIRDAERTRPAALRNPGQRERSPAVQLIGRTLTADEVAEQAVAGDPGAAALRDHARGGPRAAAAPVSAARGGDPAVSGHGESAADVVTRRAGPRPRPPLI